MATFKEQFRRIQDMPTPQVDNLIKATPQQLADEVIMLRNYIAHMLMWAREIQSMVEKGHVLVVEVQKEEAPVYDPLKSSELEGEHDNDL